jgi:hypothetical protein
LVTENSEKIRQKKLETQILYKKYHDKKCKELTQLEIGQKVVIQDPISKLWNSYAMVQDNSHPRSYTVTNINGKQYRRNRIHLRPISEIPKERELAWHNKIVNEFEDIIVEPKNASDNEELPIPQTVGYRQSTRIKTKPDRLGINSI